MFRYVNLWSRSSTWGGAFAPGDGQSLHVPKGLHLLFDIDTSPELNLVAIYGGSLIFPCNATDPNHVRKFDAHYIYVRHGYIEAGTEEEPYCSKLEITRHGTKDDIPIPMYGNKVIGVRYG